MVRRKKNKNFRNIIIGLVIIAVIAIALFYSGIVPQTVLGGYTSLSISNIEVIDSGNRIRIYGIASGAEEILINIRADDISSFISDEGYAATNGISGSIRLVNQVKKFTISKNLDESFLNLRTFEIGLFDDCYSTRNTPDGYVSLGNIPSLSLKKSCFYKKSIGTNSIFTGQSIRDSEVSINIGDASGTLRPSAGINVITLNDGKTSIEWVGDLSNYNQISTPFGYTILFHESEFKKLIRDNAFALSRDESNRFASCIGSSSSGTVFLSGLWGTIFSLPSHSKIEECIISYNNKVNGYLVDRTSDYSNSINAEKVSFSDNSLDVDLKIADSFPTFIITLDAESVGIIELAGTPEIVVCVQKETINSGDSFNPILSVKNIGSSAGSFYGNVICEGEASASGIITETFVEEGEIVRIPVQITGSNIIPDTTKKAKCTYTIIDRKSGDSDSCVSTLEVEYQSGIVCEPSTVKCIDDKTLRTCSSDGETFSDITCEGTCKNSESGIGECKADGGNGKEECKLGQQYRFEGDRLFGIFPGRPKGCYTAGWVYLIVILSFITIVLIIIALRVKKKMITGGQK